MVIFVKISCFSIDTTYYRRKKEMSCRMKISYDHFFHVKLIEWSHGTLKDLLTPKTNPRNKELLLKSPRPAPAIT